MLVWTAGIVIAVVLLASFMGRGQPTTVRAATAERSSIRTVISTNGQVEALNNFEAHAPLATTVKRLLVHEGDHVTRGKLLLELDDAEARSQVARALAQLKSADAQMAALQSGGTREEVISLEAQLAKARAQRDTAQRNLEAFQKLEQQGAAAPGEVKAAQDQLAAAQAELKALQQKQSQRYSQPEIAQVESQRAEAQAAYSAALEVLNKLNIRAPFDGEVYSIPVQQGNFVQPGDMLLQEADLSKVRGARLRG